MDRKDIDLKLQKIQEFRERAKSKLNHATVSVPEFKAPYGHRTILEITPNMLESFQYSRNWIPFADHNSTQRNDMSISQEKAMVVPLHTEVPFCASAMCMDMFEKSSVIERIRGKITKLAEITYQSQRIIVYKHNGRISLLDTDGTHDNGGYMVYEHTDLDLLKMGEEYDINSDDSNFTLRYPHCYNPVNSMMTRGNNFLTMMDINTDMQGDSIKVSESFCDRMTFAKISRVSIDLKDRIIISKYKNIFPPLKTILEDPIVFKIVENEGEITKLTQTHDVPISEEETQLIVHPNSYINRIRVICNEPIENPILENYRQEYIQFRKDVYATLNRIVTQYKDICDEKVLRYLENFKYFDKLRTSDKVISKPFITIDIVTFVRPNIGSKVTNSHGAKGTIEKIYPDGEYKDPSTGRNIDVLYSSLTFVNRIIMGFDEEHFLSAVFYCFVNAAKKMNADTCYKHFIKLCTLCNINYDFENRFTPEEIHKLCQNYETLPVAVMPWSNDFSIKRASQIRAYAVKHFGMAETDIEVSHPEYGDLNLTVKHLLGYTYQHIDHHDTMFGNSSTSQPETDTKGLAKEKNDEKANLESLRSKKACKEDVQLTYNLTGLLLNHDLKSATVNDGNRVYIVTEELRAIGADIYFEQELKPKEDE